jgi:hypothetical protein
LAPRHSSLARERKAKYPNRRFSVAANFRNRGKTGTTMGKFDTRNSQKMKRRKRQRKLKERLARRAEAVKATRTKKPSGKKKG